jgi:hypothetical protein
MPAKTATKKTTRAKKASRVVELNPKTGKPMGPKEASDIHSMYDQIAINARHDYPPMAAAVERMKKKRRTPIGDAFMLGAIAGSRAVASRWAAAATLSALTYAMTGAIVKIQEPDSLVVPQPKG